MLATVATLLFAGCEPPPEQQREIDPHVMRMVPPDQAHIRKLQYSDTGFTAVVTRGDAQVTIDLERAGRHDMDLLQHPEDVEPFVSNFRVYNRSGYPFIIVGDGMLSVNPETGQVDIAPPAHVDHQNQLNDLRLVLDAIGLLASQSRAGTEFKTDLARIGNAASAAIDNADAVFDGRIAAPTSDAARINSRSALMELATGQVGQALTTTYIQNFFIKYKPSFWIYGDHSAVKIDVYYSSGQYIGYLSTRNHGTEADDPSMTTVSGCPRAFYNRPTTLPPIQPFVSTDTSYNGDAGGCSTSYGWVGSNVHVCNDDSLAMLHMAINNAVITNDPTCSDGTLRNYAPSCY
jgi:hypothetical protein